MASTQLKAAAAEAAPAKKKKSKKKLVLIVVPVLVLAAAGYLFMGKGGSKAKPAPKPGAVVALDPITINLAGGHYLKLGLALQATKTAKEPPVGAEALDLAIEIFSNKSTDQLDTDAGRNRFKAELRTKVIKAYTPEGGTEEVMDVYFTEFVMQ